ncbi:RHS repeat domain-containing protein [Thermoflexibacter ruber]|uniref:RHS repeat-associated core domain-containing protein n=1 Tax=Thermoflexibacter ruber TaxID=1003 RepID=A0A1I2I974_9BACT|nr:RHS repeat-associated core domain-containing protein [Thermoflexibacter ruber]SFF37416.1 RHS repeat-associated core domain-containing protein [Thermoflexibacter ruber]
MRTFFIEDLQSDFAVAEQPVTHAGETAWEELAIGFTTTQQVRVEAYVISTEPDTVFYTWFDDLKIEITDKPTAMVVQENHYYPFGLGMKGLDYVQTASKEDKFQFNGKEKQTELSLNHYDFSARSYDYQIGRTTTLDPHADRYVNVSAYSFLNNNPLITIDPTGKDGIIIIFPSYQADGYPLTGHAGILLIDNKTGVTAYYEYGRYNGDRGEVRQRQTSKVIIGEDGKPTIESLNKVLSQISKSNKGRHISGHYFKSDKFNKMKTYAEKRKRDNKNKERVPYNIISNNCGTFACEVASEGSFLPTWNLGSPILTDFVLTSFDPTYDDVYYYPGIGTDFSGEQYSEKEKKAQSIKQFFIDLYNKTIEKINKTAEIENEKNQNKKDN